MSFPFQPMKPSATDVGMGKRRHHYLPMIADGDLMFPHPNAPVRALSLVYARQMSMR